MAAQELHTAGLAEAGRVIDSPRTTYGKHKAQYYLSSAADRLLSKLVNESARLWDLRTHLVVPPTWSQKQTQHVKKKKKKSGVAVAKRT